MTGPSAVLEWNVQDVAAFIASLEMEAAVPRFVANSVSGRDLLNLSDEELHEELGLTKLQIKKLHRELDRLSGSANGSTTLGLNGDDLKHVLGLKGDELKAVLRSLQAARRADGAEASTSGVSVPQASSSSSSAGATAPNSQQPRHMGKLVDKVRKLQLDKLDGKLEAESARLAKFQEKLGKWEAQLAKLQEDTTSAMVSSKKAEDKVYAGRFLLGIDYKKTRVEREASHLRAAQWRELDCQEKVNKLKEATEKQRKYVAHLEHVRMSVKARLPGAKPASPPTDKQAAAALLGRAGSSGVTEPLSRAASLDLPARTASGSLMAAPAAAHSIRLPKGGDGDALSRSHGSGSPRWPLNQLDLNSGGRAAAAGQAAPGSATASPSHRERHAESSSSREREREHHHHHHRLHRTSHGPAHSAHAAAGEQPRELHRLSREEARAPASMAAGAGSDAACGALRDAGAAPAAREPAAVNAHLIDVLDRCLA